MNNIYEQYSASINTLFSVLYATLQGKKIPHNDVVQKVRQLYPIILPDLIASLDHNAIVKEVVDRYVSEVGIKTFDPEFIDLDKEAKYWLYKEKDGIPHPFFDRYKLYLANDGFEPKVIDNIELTCERILARCANPKTIALTEKKKGLVVGDVQSGKTANYLGLINMAYDYGYRIVILLAGTTNSLREQTQKRTDSGVIGAKSDSIGNSIEFLGVGLNTNEHFAVPFTNQANDFKRFMQRNLNVAIADINKPVVLVVKKVKSVLESVAERLQSELRDKGLDCKSILIIDDEADNASITTSKDPDKPTTINRCIRDIFNEFPIASYVGYTATPFANIFINPNDDDNYLDLFPTDFIAQLHAPSTYFGGRLVFPNDDSHSRYVRLISENESNFLPVIHDKYVPYPAMADSLKEAIHSFVICNVIRTLRGHELKHRSMMINITRYNDTQALVWERVTEYLEKLKNAIEQLSDMSVDDFCKNQYCRALYDLYYNDEFFKEIREGSDDGVSEPITWEQIQAGLYDEIKQFIVLVINSRNGQMNNIDPAGKKKRFDYDDKKDVGARVIAIGGMVLSRGLTLEGLMTSYYSRNAGAYDTLLQMCRWFGYRPKYMDLCRIYLSQVSIDQFDAVLTATEDLKEQFSEMQLRDKKPIDFGLMIKECPDTLDTTLLITSRNKMHGTQVFERSLNYSGVYADTSKMSKSAATNRHNIEAFMRFCRNVEFSLIGKDNTSTTHKYYMAQNVSQHYIAQLFREITVPIENKKFNTAGLAEYAEESDKFKCWDVVIASGSAKDRESFMSVRPVERSFHMKSENDLIRIGGANNRVLDPGLLNAGLWYKEGETLSAKEYLKHRTTPILVVFPIDLKVDDESNKQLSPEEIAEQEWKRNAKAGFSDDVLLAFAYAFPDTETKVMVKYRANAVMIEQLTAGIETDDDEEGVEDTDD
jgi:hypothetical protein